MAPKPIVVRVLGDADSLDSALKKGEKAVDSFDGKTEESSSKFDKSAGRTRDKAGELGEKLKEKLGVGGDVAGGAIDKLGSKVGSLPVPMLAGAAAAAGLAAGLVKLGQAGVNAFRDTVADVKQLQAILGGTTHETAVLRDVLREAGLSADEASDVFENFGSMDLSELEAMGIVIEKNADGTDNYTLTLRNLITEMASTTDQARRAELGSKAFGEQWFRLKPLLDQGKISLDELYEAAENNPDLINDSDIEASMKLDKAMREAKQAVDDILITIGKVLVPVLGDMISDFARFAQAVDKLNDKTGILKGVFEAAIGPAKYLTDGLGWIADKAGIAEESTENLTEAVDNSAQAEEDAAKAADELKASLDAANETLERQEEAFYNLIDAQRASIDSSFAVRDAQNDVFDAQQKVAEATDKVTEAINTYGADTPQAIGASRDLANAESDLTRKQMDLAAASAEMAIKQREANGEAVTAKEKNDILIGAIDGVRASLTPGSAAYEALSGWIGQLQAVPRNVTTTVGVTLEQVGISQDMVASVRSQVAAAFANRATGGPAQGPTMVGERGPELLNLPSGSHITPNHALGSSTTGGTIINVNVARTNASPGQIGSAVEWAIRTSGRG